MLKIEARSAMRGSRPIHLTGTEFALTQYLMQNARRVCSKQELLRAVWGADFSGGQHVVELYVTYIRRKIDTDGDLPLIHTVRGAGYILRTETASAHGSR